MVITVHIQMKNIFIWNTNLGERKKVIGNV